MPKGEADFIRKIAEQSGTKFSVFDSKELQSSREGMKRWIRKQVPRWIEGGDAESKTPELA